MRKNFCSTRLVRKIQYFPLVFGINYASFVMSNKVSSVLARKKNMSKLTNQALSRRHH